MNFDISEDEKLLSNIPGQPHQKGPSNFVRCEGHADIFSSPVAVCLKITISLKGTRYAYTVP